MAGLALGRASHHHGVQRLLVTALAVAAVPLASSALGSLLGLGRRPGRPRGHSPAGPARTFADREARRRQLRRAAAGAFDQASAEGSLSAEERGLMVAILVGGWVGGLGWVRRVIGLAPAVAAGRAFRPALLCCAGVERGRAGRWWLVPRASHTRPCRHPCTAGACGQPHGAGAGHQPGGGGAAGDGGGGQQQ